MASGAHSFLRVMAGTGLLILGIAGGQAKAATLPLTTTGTTVGASGWNRPTQDGTQLDTNANNVPYSSQMFYVDQPGTYNFLSVSVNPANWDNFTFLYQNSFVASAPLANFVIGNDDNPIRGQSGFSSALTANTQYFFVTTGANNFSSGSFNNTFSGGPAGSNLTFGTAPAGATPVPFEFSPGLGLSILGAWFGVSQLRTRIGKYKSIPETQDQDIADAVAIAPGDNS